MDIVIILIFGALGALTTKFVEYLIGDPWDDHVHTKAIFSRIGLFVAEGYDRCEADRKAKLTGETSIEKRNRISAGRKNWYMAMGACYYCLNVYVTAAVCIPTFLHYDVSLWFLILSLAVSHFTIEKVM